MNKIIIYRANNYYMDEDTDFTLIKENLIPFYLIEDRLKENFNKIEKNTQKQLQTNQDLYSQIMKINQYNEKYKQQVQQKFILLQKKIISEISSDLQGRIIVAINKNMSAFNTRIEEKQKQISKISQRINEKLEGIKKNVIQEVTKDNQKFFLKESQKLQKKMKNNMEETLKKNVATSKQGIGSSKNINKQKQHNENIKINKVYNQEASSPHEPQTYFNEEWVIKIRQMQSKMGKFEQFTVNFEKRFYQNMASLKDSWKQLGEQVLDTKRKLVVKQDELKLQLIKIKGIKQLQGSPDDFEQTFKIKLMNKFTDIYQAISQLSSKTDLEGALEKVKKTINRHDSQIIDVRQQMGRNSDYFTFYMNNSNQQDLSKKIKELNEKISQNDHTFNQKIKKQNDHNQVQHKRISELNQHILELNNKNAKLQKDYSQLRQSMLKDSQRLQVLQDQNKFSPEKMAKIHNTLDIDFTPSEQELLAKKNHTNTQNTAIKQLKGQINKLKDQLFVLNHQFAQVENMKKNMTTIQTKIDKIKIQSEQAILSRKPWVCLSCDKQKQQGEKVKRQISKKKLAQNRAGLFTKQKSDKLIKLIPSSQDKFEIYEKYRQKYLSDTVRLPEIYKEKIGDKQP